MTAVTRLLPALLVAVLTVGALLWWLERPPVSVPQPPPEARDDAGTERAEQVRELRRRLEAQRAALSEARTRRADADDELERVREALAETRARIERLEARTGEGGEDAGD